MIADDKSLALSDPLRIDLAGAAFKQDPLPTFARMREAGHVVPVRIAFVGRTWMTVTHAATEAMVKTHDLFVQESRHAGKSGIAGWQWWMPQSLRLLTNNMLLKDEPDHRRLRKLVDQSFQRRGILEMRPRIEALANSILDRWSGRDEVDLTNEFARRLPLDVICELLGFPDTDRQAFANWANSMVSLTSAFGIVRMIGSLNKIVGYVREQVEECRRNPRPGLISELIRAEQDGDKLDESELLSMVFLLLVAGFETTTHLISASVIALDQNPAQKAFLLSDPSLHMERGVEELARFMSPVQMTKPRFVSRDCDFLGQKLQRGELIMGLLAAANADPAVFERPEDLRLDRFPNPHLVFSSGIHFCLGMQLARVETQSALKTLYARYPDLRVSAPQDLDWIERIGMRGVKSLPVRLNSAAQKAA